VDEATNITCIFNSAPGLRHNVRLIGGAPEPVYLPVAQNRPNAEIHFRESYAASALHELAHWCLVGKKRLEIEDYGYWYEAARGKRQQQKFEAVEVKPQAAEWILSVAAGTDFRVSSDNFSIENLDVEPFRVRVAACALAMVKQGLPLRLRELANALSREMPNGNSSFDSELHYQRLPDK